MSQGLSTTSYALLGLLVFDGTRSDALTGYELKQRADRTLGFYWVAPAMSQVYSELDRLTRLGLLTATPDHNRRRHTRRYHISAAGIDELNQWLTESEPEFPILKHPVALRLMMGGLIGPERVRQLLGDYLDSLAERKASLAEVRLVLGDSQPLKYPAMVADWGLSYYDSEAQIVLDLMKRLTPESQMNGSH